MKSRVTTETISTMNSISDKRVQVGKTRQSSDCSQSPSMATHTHTHTHAGMTLLNCPHLRGLTALECSKAKAQTSELRPISARQQLHHSLLQLQTHLMHRVGRVPETRLCHEKTQASREERYQISISGPE